MVQLWPRRHRWFLVISGVMGICMACLILSPRPGENHVMGAGSELWWTVKKSTRGRVKVITLKLKWVHERCWYLDYSLTFWHVFTRWFCFIMHQGASWNLCPTFVAPHSASIFSGEPRPVAAKAASVRLIHRTFVHDAGSSVISFWNQTPRKGWTWTSHDELPGGPAAICCNLRHHFRLKYRKADGSLIIVRRFLGCPVITWSFSGHCWGSGTWSSWKEASQTTLIGASCIP